MKRRDFLVASAATGVALRSARATMVPRKIKVTLPQAHKGTLEVDTNLLDSYGPPPENTREFYFAARKAFSSDKLLNFDSARIVQLAKRHSIDLMGGPLLGNLKSDGVTIWMRPTITKGMQIRVAGTSYPVKCQSGQESRTRISGLSPDTSYKYAVIQGRRVIAQGSFRTAPKDEHQGELRIAFGSCFHKIGVHNPNLFREILGREPAAMMLLGDLAVDDRNSNIAMHRSDYQLRDSSPAWQQLASHLPLYTAWDDHDYFDNDLNGIPKGFIASDRDALRKVWKQNWNNPQATEDREGIYFNARIGPAEIMMLDTRSCRDNKRRRKFGSYLGDQQLDWLLETLSNSTAPFKIISSGTMWSDYVSNAKDSWGSWDVEAREKIFSHIEDHNIAGVLLVSGDRHGARAFRIPRPSGFAFHEFEPATLGGVTGPAAWVDDCPEQIFGYGRDELIAFGEFTFDTSTEDATVTFRLIKETGEILEEHRRSYDQLTPQHSAK
ncbi:MAG: alkaline phosphatase D family protein [Aureliella sp.]